MATPGRLMTDLDIDEPDLIKHYLAHEALSRTGSEVKLKKIPAELRNKCAKFYKILREKHIYPQRPRGESMKFLITGNYYEIWHRYLKNQKERPELQFITLDEVKAMLRADCEEVKHQMKHRIRLYDDQEPIKHKYERETEKIKEIIAQIP